MAEGRAIRPGDVLPPGATIALGNGLAVLLPGGGQVVREPYAYHGLTLRVELAAVATRPRGLPDSERWVQVLDAGRVIGHCRVRIGPGGFLLWPDQDGEEPLGFSLQRPDGSLAQFRLLAIPAWGKTLPAVQVLQAEGVSVLDDADLLEDFRPGACW